MTSNKLPTAKNNLIVSSPFGPIISGQLFDKASHFLKKIKAAYGDIVIREEITFQLKSYPESYVAYDSSFVFLIFASIKM